MVVLRILTAVPIWEGCASKKALRGVIIGLSCILLSTPLPFRAFTLFARDRKERNEIRDSNCEGRTFVSLRRAFPRICALRVRRAVKG